MRRLFWVSVGAGLGISGYRRANRVIREITGSASRAGRPGPRIRLRQLGGVAGFVRDVRDGMDLYAEQQRLDIERRRAPERPTLGLHQVSSAGAGRNGADSTGASRNGTASH